MLLLLVLLCTGHAGNQAEALGQPTNQRGAKLTDLHHLLQLVLLSLALPLSLARVRRQLKLERRRRRRTAGPGSGSAPALR